MKKIPEKEMIHKDINKNQKPNLFFDFIH